MNLLQDDLRVVFKKYLVASIGSALVVSIYKSL